MGLDGISGPEGCIFPSANPPSVSQVPEVHLARQSVSVPGSLFWPRHCPAGIYQGHGASLCMGSSTRFQHAPLSGQLAGHRILSPDVYKHCLSYSWPVHSFGHSVQSAQVRSSTKSEETVPGYGTGFGAGSGISIIGKGDQVSVTGSHFSGGQSSYRGAMEVTPTPSSFPGEDSSRGPSMLTVTSGA